MVRAGVDPQAIAGRGGGVFELSEEGGVVLESGFLFSADFVRVGDDLLLRGEDGREVLVRGYFAQDPPPPLETVEGARLLPETVDGLAIPEAPLAYAQAGTVQLAEPIGQVSTLSGSARVQRPDGTRANLSEGDPIFEGDVVSTGVGSELGILFVDDTVFSLSANARMVINELIYNPSSTANSMGISLIQGTFVFITGKVAPSGGIDVDTPVGTIGIRGTTVGVQIATFGGRTQIANLTNPETGELGSFTFSNNVGDALFSLANHFLDVSSATVDPGVPSVASGQAIAREFGRALNRAVEVQRSVSQDQPEDEPEQQNPDETQEGELEVDQLQAVLEEAGLTQEQIEALQTEAPIETGAGQQGQAGDGGAPSISQGSSLGGSLQTEAVSDDLGGVEDLIGGETPSGLDPAPPTEGVTTVPPVETVEETTEPPPPPAPPNAPPTVAGGAAAVLEGGLVAIGPAAVSASDAETGDPAQLVYTVAAVSNGLLVRTLGDGFQVVFSFTQADLDSGSVFFAHDGSETTDAGFTVTVADPDGGVSDPVAIPITVTPLNDPPVLVNNMLTVGEGQEVTLTAERLSATDSDNDDAGLVFTVSNVTGGRFELRGGGFQEEGAISAQQVAVTSFTQQQVLGGDIVFIDDGDETAPSYNVSVSDGETTTEPAPAAIDYTPVNDPPTAEDDGGAGFATDEDSAFTTASVLGNDSDPEDDPLNVTEVNGNAVTVGQQITLGSGALLTLNADGSFDYDPSGRFESLGGGDYGEDVFEYRVSDGNDGSDTATVSITVNGVNDPPVLINNTLSVEEGQTVNLDGNDLSATDVDDDDGSLIFTVSDVTGGRFALGVSPETPITSFTQQQVLDGAIVFVDDGDETAPSYNVSVSDGQAATVPAPAAIDYTPVNDLPVLVNNALTVSEGETVTLDGTALSATDVDDNDGGLIFTVSDVTGGRFALGVSPETPITSFTQQQVLGGDIVFIDDGDETAPSYNVSVSDGETTTEPAPAAIDYTPVNDPPTAEDDGGAGFATDEDSAFTTASVLGNDSDPEDDPLNVTEVNGNAVTVGQQITLGSGALLTLNADGSFDYDPNGRFEGLGAGDYGEDVLEFRVSDGNDGSDTATVTIAVNGVNDPPTAEDDGGAGFATDEDSAFTTASVLGNDSDPEDDPLTVTEVNGNAVTVGQQITLGSGALLTLNADGSFDYDPNGRFEGLGAGGYGEDVFEYRVSDGNDGSDTATVSITVNGVNDPPLAEDDGGAGFATDEDSAFTTASVLGNDSDPEGDPLSVTEVNGQAVSVGQQITLGSGALLTLNTDGSFDYDPNGRFEGLGDGDYGEDIFEYRVSDGNDGSDTATVSITVNGVNDPPLAADDGGAGFVTDEDSAFTTASVLGNDSDPEGDPLTVTEVNGQAVSVGQQIALGSGALLTLNADGSFDYDPNGRFEGLGDGDYGEDIFEYRVSDGNDGSDTATVTITLNGVNDPPTAEDDGGAGFATDEDSAFTTASVLGNDSDPEDDPLNVTEVNGNAVTVGQQITLGSGALLTLNADGSFDYDPNGRFEGLGAGDYGEDVLEFRVSDGNDGSDTATVTIAVNGVNDPPVVINNILSVEEGETITLSGENLSATDADDDDGSLIFTVSDVTGGRFALAVSPETPITSFTQQQVLDGAIVFVDDGDEVSPGYNVSVSDGQASTVPVAAEIDYTPVNDDPVVTSDTAGLVKGASLAITTAILSASDVETTDPAQLTFTVTAEVAGEILLSGAPAASFTLADVIAGLVTFQHDGSDGAAAGFTVTASDPDGGVSLPADLSFAVAASFVWTNGTGNGDWNNPLNWASGSVPIDGADVVIPDQPGAAIFSSGSTVLQSLTLESESLVITGGSFAVTGELTSEIGSTIAVSGGSFEVAGGTLNGTFAWTGGTVTGDGATLTINGPANLGGVAPLTLDIDLDLNGLGAMTGNIQGGGAIANGGSLLVPSAATLGVGFSNEAEGSLAVFSNLTIDNGSGFRNSGSITIAAFATLAVVGGDFENAFGAEIGGEGIIDVTGGSLINNGTINPGTSPGTFTVLGDYEQGPDGLLTVEIDGTGGDLLQVGGTASFAGVIEVVFLNGFVPTAGDTLNFVQATEIIDNGVEVTGLNYAGGLLGIQLAGGVASFVAITGGGDTFVDPFEIIVGDAAFGSLTVDAGQDLASQYFSVGEQVTGIGEFVLTNASTLTIQGPSFIGKAGIGDATISGGAQAVFGSDEADNLVIGNVFGSFGTLLLDGPGTSVTTTGESNRVQVGLEGTGEVVIQNEASLNTLLLDIGVSGTGSFVAQGLGTQVTASNDTGLFPGDFADRAGVVRVGRDAGGDGTLEVRDGARMEIRAGIGVNEDTNGPTLQIGRDAGSTGSVLIDGTNSAIELTQTAPSDPDNDIFGPFVAVGYAGEGALEIRNGGKLNLTSEFVDFTAARQETGEGTVLVDGSESAITLTGEGVFASIGREGTGSVTLSNGAKFSLVGGDDDFTRLIVGLENGSVGTLNVRSGSEVYVQGGDANTRLRIGREEGSEGTVTVTGDGSLLDVGGTNANESFNNRIEVGKEGTGTLNTLDGASVVAERLDLGFGPTGIGTALVDDATWEIGAGGLRVGREGDGTLTIQNGGSVIVDEELTIATAGGSSGTLNVLGGGDSTTELTVNEDLIVGAGWFDPNDPDFGSDTAATGVLNIDGAVVTSQGAFVGDGKHGIGEATVDSGEWNVQGELFIGLEGDGTLDVRNGGSVNVAGDYNSIANSGGSAGSVSIDAESSLTVGGKLNVGLGWFDPAANPTFGQSTTATGSLAVNGGSLATQGVEIGGQRLGVGEAVIDGGTWTDTSGPESGFAVGQAGDGTLVLRNGASVTTNGGFNSIGNAGGSRGSVTVDATSSLTYEGYLSVGNGFYDPIEFPDFGRDAEATGSLTIDGGTVTAQNADIGGTERGRGFVTIDGDGALFDAGGSLNIGHLGKGTVTLRDGGELRADTVSVGADGSLGGVGLVDGDVFINGGTVDPGLSPGELEVDGSFTLNDGLLLFEIAGTTPGTGHDVLTVSSPNPGFGNVNLNGGVIQFDFDPDFTPQVSDSFAFLNYASLAVSDHVAYRFTGVDPTNFIYGFIDDAGTRSLGFLGNSVSLGNGVVFEGGEGDDYEAGSAFADRIEGAEGSDTLGGAGGNDTLTGGDYGDTFVFTLAPLDAGAPGADLTITDFFPGEDVIEVIGWDSTSPDGIVVTGTDYGTLLDFGDGYSIHLDFVYGYVLSPDDFVFRVLAIGEVSRNSDNHIVIGSDYGDGRLEIRDGAEVAAQDVVLGGGAEGGGELLVTGSGSKLTSSGEDAIIEIGENAGGDATVSGGAKLEGLWINIARNGTGTMTVTDDGTVIDLSNEFGTFSGSGDVDEGAFFRIGRNAGSDGTLKVLSGAVVNIEASPGFNSPGLQVARNHESKGTVLVDGDGSQINITQTDLPDPGNDIFGPYLTLRSGEGDLTIQNDGAVRLFGQDASVSVGRGNADAFDNPGDAPVLQQSVLKILTGGSLTVDGDDGFADLDIGQEANGNGAVEVRGDGSALLLEGLAPTIEVGLGGAGTLLVDQGGRVTATSMGIGRRIGSEGDVTIDGGQDQEVRTELRLIGQHSDGTGAFLQIGREGVGNLSLMGGALLTIDGQGGAFPGFFLGRNADGNGTIIADGVGTELIITNGDDAPRGGFGLIGVGREGTGTLEVTQGASVVNAAGGYAFVGREVGSQGEVIVDGLDGTATLFDAGAVLVVGADYDSEEILFDSGGTGSVTVADGGTVRAGAAQGDGITDIFIGSGGTVTVQAGGSLIGDIENVGGTLINGNSPGTAAFGGDFAMSDGVLEVELGGTEAGAFDLYQIAGTADFTGGVIEFSMIEGYDPLAGDSFIFLTAGALALDEDALSFVVRGVDQAFDFALDLGADSLGLTVLNDAGSGESLVFLGGEGDEVFAGGVGDDRLDGGGGRDSLTGGDGSDIFVLRAADGAESLDLADIIADFEIGSDSLGLAEGLGAEDLTITATEGGDAAVALQSSGAILAVLQGVSAADIDPAEITTVV